MDEISLKNAKEAIPIIMMLYHCQQGFIDPGRPFVWWELSLYGPFNSPFASYSRGISYLSRLNLPDSFAVLTLLAGPLSGLFVQPIIGALSDECTFKIGRRRHFIILGSIIACLSMLGITFSKEVGGDANVQLVSLSQNEKRKFSDVTIVTAIFSFYVLNSSLYIVQSSCRSLIIDVHPIYQQARAHAFAGNIISITNVAGFLIGSIDLVHLFPIIVNVGDQDAQLKIFCFISIAVFCITVTTTSVFIKEDALLPATIQNPVKDVFKYMWQAIRKLPSSIQRLCLVQFFASFAWFPTLFYSAAWVAGINSIAIPKNSEQLTTKDSDQSERVASFALPSNASVAVALGFIFPWIVSKNWISIKNIFSFSLGVLSLSLMCTHFVLSNDLKSAYIIVAVVGIASASSTWIPFTLIGEYIEIEKLKVEHQRVNADLPSSTVISFDSNTANNSNDSIQEIEFLDKNAPKQMSPQPLESGVLVVYNLLIVIPHLIMVLVSSLIFAAVNNGQGDTRARVTGIGWVLQLGGLMTIFATILSRRIDNV